MIQSMRYAFWGSVREVLEIVVGDMDARTASLAIYFGAMFYWFWWWMDLSDPGWQMQRWLEIVWRRL